VTPVTLPPGRFKLETRRTASLPWAKTIGMVAVEDLAAMAETTPPVAKIAATGCRTRSAAMRP
jgi:hypothetical protein